LTLSDTERQALRDLHLAHGQAYRKRTYNSKHPIGANWYVKPPSRIERTILASTMTNLEKKGLVSISGMYAMLTTEGDEAAKDC
jgi:hypothetical protein